MKVRYQWGREECNMEGRRAIWKGRVQYGREECNMDDIPMQEKSAVRIHIVVVINK